MNKMTEITDINNAQTREIKVGGAVVPYRVFGSGRPLVLVHGTNEGSGSWEGVAEEFADVRTVVLPDLSGSDAARDDGGELTVTLLAGQVAAVIGDLGRGPADVVGHSLGGSVAAELAATRPELVHRLVPVAGLGAPDAYMRNLLTVWTGLAGDPAAFSRFAMMVAFSRGQLGMLDAAGIGLDGLYPPAPGRLRQLALVASLDVWGLLPRISAPTLVIGCGQDTLVAPEQARAFAAAVPGAGYAEVDCGHLLMRERPEEFVRLVRDFLTEEDQ
ncbi:alpha/beta fold hydrolase [Actinospica robiniae]|uniref:alpha/beta fold hydrolase n=1 Tax=Actinospica robiniae TaxID=304901 RepID=UPI00041F4C98|nr:alpha/beta hydrolase [Actinospica robiniae]